MRHLLAATLLVATAAVASEFTTKPARDAETTYQRDANAAREAYEKAMQAAAAKYSKALDAAARKATEAGNLDEAIRIRDRKAALESANDERRLWVHGSGYFQRLADGAWVELVGTGDRHFFRETARESAYIELTRDGAVVQLAADRAVLKLEGSATFTPLAAGEWRN